MMSLKQKRVKFKARIKLSHNTYALVQLHKIHMLISSISFWKRVLSYDNEFKTKEK